MPVQYNMSYASVCRLSVLVTVHGPDIDVAAGKTTVCTSQFVWVPLDTLLKRRQAEKG